MSLTSKIILKTLVHFTHDVTSCSNRKIQRAFASRDIFELRISRKRTFGRGVIFTLKLVNQLVNVSVKV